MNTDVVFANQIFAWFVGEVSFILGRIKGLEKTEGRMKVAQALEFLLKRHAKPKNDSWHRVKFPVSQQFLADLVGLTRETVSTIMKELDEQQVVHYPRQMRLEINENNLNKQVGT